MDDVDNQLDELVNAACVVCGGIVEPAYRGTSFRPLCETCQCSRWQRLKCRGGIAFSGRALPLRQKRSKTVGG
jgi:hypothetical protein